MSQTDEITRPEQINLILRREIEARIVGPLIRAFMDALGREQALAVVQKVVADLGRQSGETLAKKFGSGPAEFGRAMSFFSAGGALDIDFLAVDDQRCDFDVKRCAYVEMYQSLGLRDLGPVLSCQRDFGLVEGFNPELRLTRTKTLMEGADACDFRIGLA